MIHLHVRSSFSLLKSTIKIDALVSKAKSYQFDALALTDLNVMHGALSFVHACKKAGIRPILGLECYAFMHDEVYSFVVLAKNDQGYQDCMQLSTLLTSSKEFISVETLKGYTQHCFVITSGDHSALDSYVINEDDGHILERLTYFNQLFNSFVCGIVMNDSGLLRIKNAHLKELCRQNGITTVALSRIVMLKKDDEESFKVLSCIDQGCTLTDKTLDVASGRYLRSEVEMSRLYDADDLEMSETIADACDVKFEFKKSELPRFQNKYGVSSSEYLRSLCIQGLKKRLNGQKASPKYVERLKYELKVIHEMGYDDYFLIVYDFIRFSRSQGIYVGPGRGSAPGSLVAYSLGITHLDPLHYDLLFERFLNPERISMPDIDTDFPDNRRDEVIEYVTQKYGKDHVAHIVTFGTLAAKQVLKDAGKALGMSTYDIDLLTKCIPNMLANRKVTLESAYRDIPRFHQYVHSKQEYLRLYSIALRLEGLPRHASTHAAGIVLSNQPIVSVCPLIQTDVDVFSTQFTMEYLEELGLIKMDFLGIRNLTIIDEIVSRIHQEGNPQFDIMKIPLDDAKTFKCIQDADTAGVFQLESEGMRSLLRQMKPNTFDEVAATIALFRPGPMENIPLYLKNRSQPEAITYDHQDLEEILKDTYGVILYQEQIMQIAQKMAGFSLAKADILRKAMAKKQLEALQSLKEDFIQGSLNKGYSQEVCEKTYDLILRFANYGFNKSHSVAYGLVAYQMAYLKANYPLYFFTSCCNATLGSEIKTSEYLFEAKKRGIQVSSPDVNLSTNQYEILDNALIYPLVGIRNVGTVATQKIMNERQKGLFVDYFDFVARASMVGINRKSIECLIQAGACDCFKQTRATMIATLEDALRYSDIVRVEEGNQTSLDFDIVSKPAYVVMKDHALRRANLEKEVLGFYLSDHPMSSIKLRMNFKGKAIIECLQPCGYVEMMGTIMHVKQHKTKKGDLMAFSSLSDETGQIDLVIMPQLYRRIEPLLVKGAIVKVKGKVDKENSCLVNTLEIMNIE